MMATQSAASKAQQAALEKMVGRYGITYPNAPEPTPGLLTFMRGLDLSLDTAEDQRRQADTRIKAKATDRGSDITRAAGRSKTNITGDLLRRGVLRSGEANTRFTQHAENVADQRADVARSRAEGLEQTGNTYSNLRDNYRQQALERLMGVEETNSTRKATSEAQELAWKRQQEAQQEAYDRASAESDLQYNRQKAQGEVEYQRQKAAQNDYLNKMAGLYARYGG